MPRTEWKIERHTFSQNKRHDNVNEHCNQNENVHPNWMPTEVLLKGLGACRTAALDAKWGQNCLVADNQKITAGPGSLGHWRTERTHLLTNPLPFARTSR